MNQRIFVDMDGTLAKWQEVNNESELYQKGFYENLLPNNNLLNGIKKLINEGKDIYILSSFLNGSEYALAEKNIWLDKYLPELPKDKRIFVNYGDNKTIYIPNGITKNDYLIDDHTKNLIDWEESGGTGIKFLNGINHKKGRWQKLMLKEDENILINLKNLLEGKGSEIFNEKILQLSKDFLNAIDNYKNSLFSSEEEIMKAEQGMNVARDKYLVERNKLKDLYKIEINGQWHEADNLYISYKISDSNNKVLQKGYTCIETENFDIDEDKAIAEILNDDLLDKINIMNISPELRSVIKSALGEEVEKYNSLYYEDLLDMWNLTKDELYEKVKELKIEIDKLGLSDCIDIRFDHYTYPNNDYIGIYTDTISYFDFKDEESKQKEEQKTKIYTYIINGKKVVCEVDYSPEMQCYSVKEYAVDGNKSAELTAEEMSKLQGYLFNEVNKLYEKELEKQEDYDYDITDEMY